ncbi:M48 family metalloprotease [Ancylobacter terrae]|uniref:M48 family metalloprotease n=1 Tax=Ancylobacter sp. sgz301288 TaxID=3342077 RepID=UPI00385DE0D8
MMPLLPFDNPTFGFTLRGRLRPAGRVLGHTMGLLAAVFLATQPVAAQETAQRRPNVIRDAEIENLLRDYMRPIYRAAGVAQQNIEVVLIGDPSFNAFVVDGRRIFVNTGALSQSETPNEIIGVLAHETGHIAGGHLARMRQQLESAQTMAIVAMLLSLGGVAAGAASGANMGGAAAAIAGPQEVIRRSLLAYQRSEEQAADRAAVSYLNATKQSARGMLKTFERFQNDQLFISQRIDPYVLSHPMATERIAALEDLARKSPYFDAKDPPALQARHDMMRAKLTGFMGTPDQVARRYPLSDSSMPARYARAISAYRYGNVNDAVRQIDALIAENPGNPYMYELKGQALLEAGRGREAVAPLRKAVQISGGNALIRMLLGQALVASGDKTTLDEAVRELSFSLQRESTAPNGWRYLAMAYGQKGDIPNADLASAQAALASGDIKLARELAGRAQMRFPTGSPGWLKADDIVNLKVPKAPVKRP